MEKEIKRLLRCFKRTELSEQDVTDAILKLIENEKVVLPQADVIKSVYCDCTKPMRGVDDKGTKYCKMCDRDFEEQ